MRWKNPQTYLALALLCLAALTAGVPLAPAQDGQEASVANNGSNMVVVRVKTADGAQTVVMVQPGQSAPLPGDVARVRVDGTGDINVTVNAGGRQTAIDSTKAGESILVQDAAPQIAVRTPESTTYFPLHTKDELKLTFGIKYDMMPYTGIGLPPSPTDGPATYLGQPLGQIKDKNPSPGEEEIRKDLEEAELTEVDYEELHHMGYETDREIWDFLNTEAGFYWYMSGSGGMFGDTVGVNMVNGAYRTGWPRQGPPIGTWVHFTRQHTVFNQDAVLEDLLRSDFESFSDNFRNLYGEFQEDTRGDAYAG